MARLQAMASTSSPSEPADRPRAFDPKAQLYTFKYTILIYIIPYYILYLHFPHLRRYGFGIPFCIWFLDHSGPSLRQASFEEVEPKGRCRRFGRCCQVGQTSPHVVSKHENTEQTYCRKLQEKLWDQPKLAMGISGLDPCWNLLLSTCHWMLRIAQVCSKTKPLIRPCASRATTESNQPQRSDVDQQTGSPSRLLLEGQKRRHHTITIISKYLCERYHRIWFKIQQLTE